jgi:hypothetical protein
VFVHGLFGHPEETWTWNGPAGKDAYMPAGETDLGPSLPSRQTKAKRKFWSFGHKERGLAQEEIQHHCESGATATRPSTGNGQKYASIFWPKMLLPLALPQLRIYSWGYDADINHLFSAPSQSTVFQHAGSLLSDLADNRISDADVRS